MMGWDYLDEVTPSSGFFFDPQFSNMRLNGETGKPPVLKIAKIFKKNSQK